MLTNKNKIKLVLICLIVTSCKTADVPKPPKNPLYQPIIEQTFCDENGQNCVIKSVCKEWNYNEKTNEWVLVKNHPLKKCHGIFGVDSKGVTDLHGYTDTMTKWIKKNCKVK